MNTLKSIIRGLLIALRIVKPDVLPKPGPDVGKLP